MSGVLVVAETRRGDLREISLELIAAGLSVKDAAGGRLVVALIGSPPMDGLGAEGVDEVLNVASPVEHFEPHFAQAALEQLVGQEEPDLVLLGHTIDSMGYGPAVAARLGLGFASDVMEVGWDGDGPFARRGAYGDKLVAELRFPDRPRTLMMVRPGAYEPAVTGGSPPVRTVEVAVDPAVIATEHLEYRESEVGDVDITKADFLLSIGRGVEDKDSLPQFEELADRMGAVLSVSRPLVDAGWMPGARQVGQSGKTVKPTVYLALGISGAVQHLAGMQKAGTIIAVNSDPEAPIFGVAHFGAVADLFDVAEQLEQQFE